MQPAVGLKALSPSSDAPADLPVTVVAGKATVQRKGIDKARSPEGDRYHRVRKKVAEPSAPVTPALVEGLRVAAEGMGNASERLSANEIGGRLRALAKSVNAIVKGGDASSWLDAEGLWLSTSAVAAAEQRMAALPSAPRALDQAFDAAWGALARLEDHVRSSTAAPVVDALLEHARAGGSPEIGRLILASGELQQLAGEVVHERAHGAVSEAVIERAKDLAAHVRELLTFSPETPLSSVDLSGWGAAIGLMKQGTSALYTSAFQAGERARSAVRSKIPEDSEYIDSFILSHGYGRIEGVVEELLVRARQHPFHTDVNGEVLVVSPSDRELEDPVKHIMDRFRAIVLKADEIKDPTVPDETFHSLRASMAVALDREAVRREVLDAEGAEPRTLTALKASLGSSNVAETGLEKLRHPVEIDRWAEHTADHFVEYFADVIAPEKHREEALSWFDRWVDRPFVAANYGPTQPMWKAAIARLHREWSPKEA